MVFAQLEIKDFAIVDDGKVSSLGFDVVNIDFVHLLGLVVRQRVDFLPIISELNFVKVFMSEVSFIDQLEKLDIPSLYCVFIGDMDELVPFRKDYRGDWLHEL